MPAFMFVTIAALGDLVVAFGVQSVSKALAWECNSSDQGGVIVQACEHAQAPFFNSMPHIDDALLFPFEDHLKMVGHVMLQRHGLDEVGAWRVHHHFKMKPGEQLISEASRSANGTVKHIVSVKTALDLKGRKILPLALTYSKRDRRWWPVQFYAFAGRDHIGDALARRYGKLNSESGLKALGELGHALLKSGLSEHIGISIRWDDIFGAAPGTVMLETTNETGRSQEFVPMDGHTKQQVTTHQFFNQGCEAAPGPTRHSCRLDCASTYHCRSRIVCVPVHYNGPHDDQTHHDQETVHFNVHDHEEDHTGSSGL